MTVQSIDPQVIYDGDAVTRVFPFGFDMAAESSLRVSFVSLGLVETVVPPEDYSVTRFAQGGEVTFNLAPPADVKVVLTRRTPLTQQVSVTAQTAYDPRVVESVWDKLTVMSQELAMAQQTMLRGAPGTDPTNIYRQIMQAADTATAQASLAISARDLAEAWAASPNPPAGPGTSSAKTEAEKARADALDTAADRVQTGLDRVQTGLDRVQTGLDAQATAADRVQTGLDVAATGADRVQTGLDRAASVPAAVTATTQAGIATTQAGIATTKASEAATSAALANGMPLGTIMHFAADTPPAGWLVCDGTVVTALYPDLRAFLLDAGSPYGLSGADPLLPDLRGEFVRGWDGGRGVDPGRVFGSAQEDAVQDHNHLQGISALSTAGLIYGSAASPVSTNRPDGTVTSNLATPYTSKLSDAAGSANARYAAETRPRNVALLPCIRAYASVVNVPGQAEMDNILQQTQVQVDDAFSAYNPPRYYWQFTASGTWTKPDGLPDDALVFVEAWGAGQGGGRGQTPPLGGRGGAYAAYQFRASDLPSSVPVSVGAGGAGRSTNGTGKSGGDSTFGSVFAAPGGGTSQEGKSSEGGGTPNGVVDAFRAGAAGGSTTTGATPGGVSIFGGNGGTNTAAGEAPGGGGGGIGTSGTSGDGARGEVRIWI